MAQQEAPLQRTGRGGAGNFRRPSNDPENTSSAKAIIKDIKDSASAIFSKEQTPSEKVEYVHHGRGGAGNLSTTTKDQVRPVQSLFDPKSTTETKPVIGRGGAGNIRTTSKERVSQEGRAGNVVNVPSEEAQEAGRGVPQPEQAHLGEGREVVHDEATPA